MNLATTLSSRLIGTLFVERGLLSESQIRVALEIQRETGQQLGQILVERFGVSRQELASIVAEQWAEMGRSSESADQAANESWRRLGEIFVERGFVTPEQLEQALARQRETGERVGEALVAQGSISKFELAGALAEQMSTLETESASGDAGEVAPVVALAPRVDEPAPVVEPSPEPPAVDEPPPAAEIGPPERVSEDAVLEDAAYGTRLPATVEPEVAEPESVEPESVEPELVEPGRYEPWAAEPGDAGYGIRMPEDTEPEDGGYGILEQETAGPEIVEPESRRASGLVAFASTPTGYRLVQLDGPAPSIGDVVELPEVGELVALRFGPSPLPGDSRTCVYLEQRVRADAAAAISL